METLIKDRILPLLPIGNQKFGNSCGKVSRPELFRTFRSLRDGLPAGLFPLKSEGNRAKLDSPPALQHFQQVHAGEKAYRNGSGSFSAPCR
ncbi:MAG: hypothetical protein IJL80_03325, partial [Treponema sp.]|nr:hypothetical protein [Treponema sp.]